MNFKKWGTFLGCVVGICLGLVVLFPKEILIWSVKHGLKAYFLMQYDAAFSCQSIDWQEGKFVCQQGAVYRLGHYEISFEEAAIHPHLAIFKGKWGGDIEIIGAQIVRSVDVPGLPLKRHSKVIGSSKWWLPEFAINLRDGRYIFADTGEEMGIEWSHHVKKKHHEGTLLLHHASHPIEIFFSVGEGKGEIATFFHNHPIALIQKVVAACPLLPNRFQTHLQQWDINSGDVKGQLRLCFDGHDLERYEGVIELTDVQTDHRNQPIYIVADKVRGEFFCSQEGLQASGCLEGGAICGMQATASLEWSQGTKQMILNCEGLLKPVLSLIPQIPTALTIDYGTLGLHLTQQEDKVRLAGKIEVDSKYPLVFGCDFQPNTFELGKGWFHAPSIPIEMFIAPFLIGDFPLKLIGLTEIEGCFDSHGIWLTHRDQYLRLQGDSFTLDLNLSDQVGTHFIDLVHRQHFGSMPKRDATYLQKSSQFMLENVIGDIRFEGDHIFVEDMQVLWRGLPLEGNLDVELKSADQVNLTLRAHCLEGQLAEGCQLLSSFYQTYLEKCPLEGLFSIQPGDFCFLFQVTPEDTVIEGTLRGKTKFNIKGPLGYSLEGDTCFAYEQQQLVLSNLSADIISPEKRWKVEGMQLVYTLNGWSVQGRWEGPGEGAIQGICQDHHLELQVGTLLHLVAQEEAGSWHVSEMKFGKIEGVAQFQTASGKWTCQKLLLAHPQVGRCEFIGAWDAIQQEGEGTLLIEALNLGQLCSNMWELTGTVSGKGNWHWQQGEGLQLDMQAEHRGLSLGTLDFGDGDALVIQYRSKGGLRLEGLEALGKYRLGALHYDPIHQHLYFEGFDFQITPDKLPWLAEVTQALFPGKIPSQTFALLSQIKQEEPLCGRMWIDLTPEMLWLQLKLKDGTYYFENQSWNIHDFSLTYDPYEIQIKTGLDFHHVAATLHLTLDSQHLSVGKIILQEQEEDDFLVAHWVHHPTQGYLIEKAQGSFAGLTCDLELVEEGNVDAFVLSGTVLCQPNRMQGLLPYAMQQGVAPFALGGIYRMEGVFSFPKQAVLYPSFMGEMVGNDCSISSVNLATLSCHCYLDRTKVELTNIAIRDWAGHLFCDYLCFSKGLLWQVYARHIAIHDFRLSRLDSDWTHRQRGERNPLRTLFISLCELNDLQGYLSDFESFIGSGKILFTNLPKRTLISNLMIIPTEITARIGLDLTNFVPVRGTVEYQLAAGRINLCDFQDMYSDAKRSQFFLAEQHPSYITFEGGLHLCVKMKQYNLLMKLAELFTVTIKGTLLRPQYLFTHQTVD